MRLGGPVFDAPPDPAGWAAAVRALGYRACYAPVGYDVPDVEAQAYVEAARKADLVIAEVGAWSNPLSPDEAARRKAREHCKRSLDLADRLGARCCVNIAGSRGESWDGPDERDLSEETFDMIVEMVRDIIDAVRPTRTVFALETMPWMVPDSPESYLRLMKAIDRPACGAHFDPVNLINSPRRYFQNGDFIRECLKMLGPFIKSCHAKDIAMSDRFMVHLDEVRPGAGHLDYATFLRELDRLDADMPLMLEHLPNAEEYRIAAAYVRGVAQTEGIAL